MPNWFDISTGGAIALAGFAILVQSLWFARRRRDLRFRWVLLLFGISALAFGGSDWVPELKGVAAVSLAGTAVLMAALLRGLVNLPGPGDLESLNTALGLEIEARKLAETALESRPGGHVGDRARPAAAPGRATVVVVESAPTVLRMVQGMLADQGFRVLVASSAAEARVLFEAHGGEIDLLLTNQSGLELAAERPGLRVLFMLGRSDSGAIDARAPIIRKPFTSGALTRKVREVLAG